MTGVLVLSVAAVVAGCSNTSDATMAPLWRQVDAAENAIYSVTDTTVDLVPTAGELHARLSNVALEWNGADTPVDFADDAGTPVYYNFHAGSDFEETTFDVFVSSGVSEHTPGWFDTRPRRVYTCYRLTVTDEQTALWGFRRNHAFGDEKLTCPAALVSALGDGAQYREPEFFDG